MPDSEKGLRQGLIISIVEDTSDVRVARTG